MNEAVTQEQYWESYYQSLIANGHSPDHAADLRIVVKKLRDLKTDMSAAKIQVFLGQCGFMGVVDPLELPARLVKSLATKIGPVKHRDELLKLETPEPEDLGDLVAEVNTLITALQNQVQTFQEQLRDVIKRKQGFDKTELFNLRRGLEKAQHSIKKALP